MNTTGTQEVARNYVSQLEESLPRITLRDDNSPVQPRPPRPNRHERRSRAARARRR